MFALDIQMLFFLIKKVQALHIHDLKFFPERKKYLNFFPQIRVNIQFFVKKEYFFDILSMKGEVGEII